MLELVYGEVFGLALDNDEPARADASGHRKIAWEINCIVPGVELFFDRGGNINPAHLEERSHRHGLLDRVRMHRKDLPIRVA